MPRLVDVSIRVLGHEPLSGAMPTSGLLELAAKLDAAGFAYLEVADGGVFDSAVRRGVESPWERIRSLKARVATPLAIGIRGRFLVSDRAVGGDLTRRFVACAATSGIDIFRVHDPLNDPDNLRDAAEAVLDAGKELAAGVVYGADGGESLIEAAKQFPDMGANRVLLLDPSGLLQPSGAGELVAELRELTGLPVGLYSQGAGRNGVAAAIEAARAGAELIACASYPVALAVHRVSSESAAQALAGIGFDPGADLDTLWDAAELADGYVGDTPIAPLVPRVSLRAARGKLPFGIVSAIDAQLRERNAGGRLDEVLDEIERVRIEAGSPPLSAPIGQVIGSQALINVLGGSRYTTIVDELRDLVLGRYGRTPGPIDAALERAASAGGGESLEAGASDFDAIRASSKGLASSDEDLLLLALFGEEAEPLLRSIRGRTAGDEPLTTGGVDQERAGQIRELVQLVQESGIGEITIEEEGMKVTVRHTPEGAAVPVASASAGSELEPPVLLPPGDNVVRVESPMVGTFYRAAKPDDAPFVKEGDVVEVGQTLCILEAMKLMNEVKSEVGGVVRKIHPGNGDPVEYGQPLFDVEPLQPPAAA